VISAVVLSATNKMVLKPAGTQRIARVTVEATIPDQSECAVLSLQFEVCTIHPSPRPLINVVTWDRESVLARTENAEVLLCRTTPFRRGDFNSDGTVDITDAISALGHLYLGSAAPPCRSAADANDDGQLDVTDPVVLLTELFTNIPAPLIPPPGTFYCGIGLRGDPLGCESYPACP